MSSQSILPHDKEAEQGVLGSIIHNNAALNQAIEILQPEYFFSPAHQELFQAMRDLSEREDPIDEITLGHHLRAKNRLDQVGGLIYIAELVDLTPVASNINVYADIVREKFQLRSLISAAMEIANQGREKPDNVEGLIQQAEGIFVELANDIQRRSFSPISELLDENFRRLEAIQSRGGAMAGLPTGFTELDHFTNGLQPSDLIIVAARPSMGKTSFVLGIARYAALFAKTPVVIFSLEMSKEQLAMRLLCSEAGVDNQKLLRGTTEDYEWDKLARANAVLSETKFFIDDTPSLTTIGLKAVARRIQAEHGLGMIVVDYLQLMTSARRSENRQQEISEISRGLKAIAKELNIPVVACAQLNRGPDARPEKRPFLSDLRESGSIEQDADLVMFIYRDEVYNKETEDVGIAEIHIAKHRNGPITTSKHGVRLAFLSQFSKFANLSLRSEEEGQYN